MDLNELQRQKALLQRNLAELLDKDSFRDAAEYAFVLAAICIRKGEIDEAKKYANQAEELLAQCECNSLEGCAAHHAVLGGEPVPNWFYRGMTSVLPFGQLQ